MSEPTRQQKCADLARVMGWKLAHNGYGLSPDYPAVPQPRALPNPYESAEDKDALLAWLAAQGPITVQVFVLELARLTADHRRSMSFEGWQIMGYLTAPREIIADAAWLALGLR